MSTLCAYENYLRDRYVLGQSVHYAAGSSSPKPKSYDREGNEYTWSDEAGDYVRQVGGPGGGRTIRLSEVEKVEIEQPQNGSNAVSAVDEKPKRRPANRKKEPQRKNSFDESQGHSNIKPDRTDETAKAQEESDAQFDASGLGLPGKSDVALKPDGIENKDAAYFVRRDLEDTTRESKTSPQNQDNVASEPLGDSDYWERAQASLPRLRGTEKQVKWADDIRKKAFNRFYWVGAWTLLRNKSYLHAKQYSRDISKYMVDEAIRQFFGSRDNAKFWIDNREDIDRVVNDSLLRICFNLDKNNWEPTQEQIKESDRKEALAHKKLDTSLYRSQTSRERSIDSVDGRKFAEKHLSRIGQLSDRQEAVDVAKSLKNIAYYSATKGDVDVVTLCKDGVSKIKDMFGTGKNDDVLQEWTEKLDRELARANKNQQKLARKKTPKENVSVEERVEASPEKSGGANGDQAARLDDAGSEASLERKAKESLSKGTPLLRKATRLRSKAKDAALKGRKEEAAELRKQADEIEAEARKHIDEATNAGVELKNRRAKASQETAYNPAGNADAVSNPVADQDEAETVWIKKSLEADEDVAPFVGEISKKLKQEAAGYAKRGDVKKTEAVLKALKTFSEKWGLEFNQKFADARLRIASSGGVSEENTASKRDMPIDPGSRTTHPQDHRYYPIDEEQIRVANSITSHFTPPVGTETTRYRQQVDEAIEAGGLRKKEVDARYHTDIDKSVKRYAKKLADWINKKWKIVGSYGSSYVVGSGNYSIRKHDQKHRRLNAHNKSYAGVEELFENISRIGVPSAQQPVSETKEPIEKPEISNSSIQKQQSEVAEEPAQEQPAKPRPERWTPLKSKMNDDDKRVVENTRKRLNFGLADFAWRIADAKEKKDWQKAKELTVLAAQRYLEQARRAYRSHGGADALAAFDETLSGEGLTVGQVRDRVVDKFRQLALMNVADLHKYAGERLDEWEAFSQGAGLPATKDKIALNRLLDKPHYAPNAVPYTPPEKGKIYEVPIDSLNLDPRRFQFKLNTNAQGVTDNLEGAEFDPMQAGIIHVWRDPDDGKDYVVNGHHRFNLAKNSGYDGKVNVRYIDADTANDAKVFGAVANIADSKGTATDVAEFIRTRGSDDIRTPAGKKIATKNKLLADGRVLSKLDDSIFRKLKNGSIDEKTARIIAAELPDDKEKQLRLFSDIERLGLDASQAQDRAWAYASIQGEKQQGSLFGDDAPMEYDVESRSKLIGEIRKALGGAKRAAQAGGSSRNNEYWESQKLATSFDRDRAKQLSKSAGQTLDFFKDHIRLTGPMQNIIKEETDEYRKAIKSGKGAEKVVERAIERIKDVAQGGDGSVRRVEGLGFEYADRLPSAKSEQTRQGVETKGTGEKQESSRTSSESLRNGTTGEVLETGGADRPSDGGDGWNLASVIAKEAKKSDIPESRVREELSSSTDKGSKKTNSSSASSPEVMSDWERELEAMKELGFIEAPSATQGRKRGTGANAARNASVPSAPQTASNKSKTESVVSSDQKVETDGDAPTPSFIHTPTTQQRIDAYFAEQRAKGRNIESLTAEDYAKIFPDEDQSANGEQTSVPKKKRGRPRIVRSSSTAQTLGNSEKIARETESSEVPKEQVQKRIAEALGQTAKPETNASPEGGAKQRRKKSFSPDSINGDVEKAVQIRDADRSQLSIESIDSMMRIAQNVSNQYGADGLRDFMRRIDVVPVAKSRPKLLQELRDFLEDYRLNRYKATFIRNM